MIIYQIRKHEGKSITKFDSTFIMNRVAQSNKGTHIGCMYLEKNGVIGYHQAVIPQLLVVIEGEGKVLGKEEEWIPVKNGDAVYWEKDEWHETRTESGMTAMVIEGEELTVLANSIK